jgi:hypothetical protein
MFENVLSDPKPSVEEESLLHDIILLLNSTDVSPGVLDNYFPALDGIAILIETIL